jgi:hypothetical protein
VPIFDCCDCKVAIVWFLQVGTACGLCVASGERSAPGIPGPIEDLPVYPGQLLHAIVNMQTWPQYVEQQGYNVSSLLSTASSIRDETEQRKGKVRCVVLTRDPLSRLRSLYTYARSGGEHWFRYESGYMQRLGDPSLTLQQSLDLFWEEFGKGYLKQSHDYIMMNLKLGCVPIKMESFKSHYNDTTRELLEIYGINSAVIPELVRRLSSADESVKSPEDLKRDAHFTSNKFSDGLVSEVKDKLMRMPEVQDIINSQRREMGAAMAVVIN